MLNLNGITVRLGGRTILDRATAALPPYSRIGLIGRNGAGKSTLMKVMIGSLEADDGSLEMPKGTRIGYIAQEAPAGTIAINCPCGLAGWPTRAVSAVTRPATGARKT
jgi:ATP-binding cassette subfamily F protein 3